MSNSRSAWILAVGCAMTLSVVAGCDSKPDAPPAKTPPMGEKPQAPLLQKKEVADWCKEHSVPESICTRCNSELIADFKKKGDWCKSHDLPESQCVKCHPELEAKFKAMAPK